MSDYPTADEEFELMYGDELELLQDHQDEGIKYFLYLIFLGYNI